MTISNVSSGLRPGVCTSSTRPSAPYEGQMIYETDTDRLLVWSGSIWTMPNGVGTRPNFLVYMSGGNGASVDGATIAYNTALYDDLSNVSSGVFTVPVGHDGIYSFTAAGNVYNVGTGGIFRLEIATGNANGIYSRGTDVVTRGTSDIFSHASLVAKLSAGSTVRVIFRVPITGNYSAGISYNWFSGTRIA